MERPLLNDPEIFPTDKVLEIVLGESYPVYTEMMQTIKAAPYSLEPEWRYYNDGKAWLCKVVFKKKTVFWLSVWNQYFRVVFYYTEKNKGGLDSLGISKDIMDDFRTQKPNGKFMPMVIEMKKNDLIPDLLKVVEYKKSLK